MNINKKLVLGALSTLIVPVALTMVVSCGSKDEDNQKAVEDAKGNVLSVLTNNNKSKASTLKAYEINEVEASSEVKDLSNFHTLLGLEQLDLSQLTNFGAKITWSAVQKDFSDVFTVTFTYSKGKASTTSETEITTVPYTKDDMVSQLRWNYSHVISYDNSFNIIDKTIPIGTRVQIGEELTGSAAWEDLRWCTDSSVDSIRIKTTGPQRWDDSSSTWENPIWIPVSPTVGKIALVTVELMKNNILIDSVPIIYRTSDYELGDWDDEINIESTTAIVKQLFWHEYDFGFIKDGHWQFEGDVFGALYYMPEIVKYFNHTSTIIDFVGGWGGGIPRPSTDNGVNKLTIKNQINSETIKTFRNYNEIPPFVMYNKELMEVKMQSLANAYANLSYQGYVSTKTSNQLNELVSEEWIEGEDDSYFKSELGINYGTPQRDFEAQMSTKLKRKSTNIFTLHYKINLYSFIGYDSYSNLVIVKHDSKMTKEWSRDIATLM